LSRGEILPPRRSLAVAPCGLPARHRRNGNTVPEKIQGVLKVWLTQLSGLIG
jgi:hypothetical protein